jgi:hypothetical protein
MYYVTAKSSPLDGMLGSQRSDLCLFSGEQMFDCRSNKPRPRWISLTEKLANLLICNSINAKTDRDILSHVVLPLS